MLLMSLLCRLLVLWHQIQNAVMDRKKASVRCLTSPRCHGNDVRIFLAIVPGLASPKMKLMSF